MLAFQGLFIYILVHWNARMTEMKRSGIEVLLAFADNGRVEFLFMLYGATTLWVFLK